MSEATEATINDVIEKIEDCKNILTSIDINIQYIGAIILTGVVVYGLCKMLWGFLEPIVRDF